jgi:alkylation response protein AidB-like acyl-CoA dehydrogenase
MDFGFNQEQELLRATARKFFESECTSEFVRARMAEPAGVTDAFWAKLAEQGWLGLIYPEEYGGAGLGFVDLTVLMEEMGRAVMPGPFFSTVLLGGLTILEAGSVAQKTEWLGKIGAGEARTTLAFTEPNARWDAAAVTVTARESGGAFTLSGTKLFVLDAHLADVLVVVARTREGKRPEEGLSLFLVPKGARGVDVKLLPTMDQTRKLCEVTFADVAVGADALLGSKDGAWAPLSRVLDRATVALCAEMCGGAQRVLDMTTEYAKIRIAFGKPIGSYQGVKHKAADMLVEIENAKSLTYYAAWAVDENVPEAPLAASMAKAYVSDAFRKAAGAGIQLHGGIGFTWEHDLHLYFKRAKSSEFTFGDGTWHRERVAQLINL